jgi:hypothetical protein
MGDAIRDGRGRRAVFTFGRLNPPTTGHAELIRAVIAASQEGMEGGAPPADAYIFPSSTVSEPERNPLTISQKIAIIKREFPDPGVVRIVDTTDINGPVKVRNALRDAGYEHITCVVGQQERGNSFARCMPGVRCVMAGRPEGFNSKNGGAISGTKVREAALVWRTGAPNAAAAKAYFEEGLMGGPYNDGDLAAIADEIIEGMSRASARSARSRKAKGGGKRQGKKLARTRRKR